jgi:hypothetical protein
MEKEQHNSQKEEKRTLTATAGLSLSPPLFSLTASNAIQMQPKNPPQREVVINNYEEISEEIHNAIKNPGTDELAVYRALRKLNQNPVAIEELKTVYKEKYKAELVADLEGDFSGDELRHVKILLGSGQTASNRPKKALDINQVAEQINKAIKGIGTDEMGVYDALSSLRNNPVLIEQLREAYKVKFKTSLDDDVDGDFSGSQLKYLKELLADCGEKEIVNVKNSKEGIEAQAIIKEIKAKYDIDINSQAGVDSIRKQYTNVPKEVTDNLIPAAWEFRELVALKEALEFYAPILGDERKTSSRTGTDQEIKTVSKVDQGIDGNRPTGKLDTTTVGENFRGSNNFSVFTAGAAGKGGPFLGGPYASNQDLVLTTIAHELGHGLLQHEEVRFVAAIDYWTSTFVASGKAGTEEPITPYGKQDAREDFCEAIAIYVHDKSRLKTKCPKRYKFLEDLITSWKPVKKP